MDEGYLWNLGNFFFRTDVMQDELLAFEPMMINAGADAVTHSRQDLDFTLLDPESFALATKKSIDYAIWSAQPKRRWCRPTWLVRCRQLGDGSGNLPSRMPMARRFVALARCSTRETCTSALRTISWRLSA